MTDEFDDVRAALLQRARLDCLMWAAGERPIREAFERDTGIVVPPAASPLDRMIDSATGFNRMVAERFIAWFDENVWGETHDD